MGVGAGVFLLPLRKTIPDVTPLVPRFSTGWSDPPVLTSVNLLNAFLRVITNLCLLLCVRSLGVLTSGSVDFLVCSLKHSDPIPLFTE